MAESKKSILEALFYGKIAPFERGVKHSPERAEVEHKIQEEKEFFKSELSHDLHQRFTALEDLYNRASDDEEIDIFTHGFTIGALIMLEVMAGKEGIINE